MKWIYLVAIQIQIELMRIYLGIDRLQFDCRDKLVESTTPCRWSHRFTGFGFYSKEIYSINDIVFISRRSTKISETILSVQPILKQFIMISVGSEPFRVLMLFILIPLYDQYYINYMINMISYNTYHHTEWFKWFSTCWV